MKGYLHGCTLSIELANDRLHSWMCIGHQACKWKVTIMDVHWALSLQTKCTFMCIEHQACKQRYLHVHWASSLQTKTPSWSDAFMTDWLSEVMITLNCCQFFVWVLLELDKIILCSRVLLVLLLNFLRNLRKDIKLLDTTVRIHKQCQDADILWSKMVVTYSVFGHYCCNINSTKESMDMYVITTRLWSQSLSFKNICNIPVQKNPWICRWSPQGRGHKVCLLRLTSVNFSVNIPVQRICTCSIILCSEDKKFSDQ